MFLKTLVLLGWISTLPIALGQLRIVEPANGDFVTDLATVTLSFPDVGSVKAVRVFVDDEQTAVSEGWQARFTIDFGDSLAARRIAAEAELNDGSVIRSGTVRTRELAISETARIERMLIGAVVKRRNQPLLDLERERFRVYLNKREVSIESFYTEDLPLDVVLMLDTSSSLRGKGFPDLQEAARVFIRQMRRQDRAQLFEFKDEPVRLSAFSDKLDELMPLVDALEPLGATALFDALSLGVDAFRGQRRVRKAMVLFTDGKDSVYESPREKAKMLRAGITRAQNNEVTIYTIGLGENIHKDALRRIAEDTGGRFHHADRMDRLPAIFGEIVEELKHQYVLGIDPQTARRGFNALEVKVRGGRAFTRKGFTRD